MRILVVSKGSGNGTGVSQATRYVARRKSDGEREPSAEATRLFSAHEDNLGDQRANLSLGSGSLPLTKDVLHLVISFAHEDDFLALGEEETERQKAVRELTRATLAQASERLNADDLRWVAGIHRNTDNPHLHLLIQRDYHDRATGRSQRLASMPGSWQVRWGTMSTGERQTQPGELARVFENLLDERLQRRHFEAASSLPTRTVKEEKDIAYERSVLDRAMLAQEAVDRLTQRLSESRLRTEHPLLGEKLERAQTTALPLREAAAAIHAQYEVMDQPVPPPALSRAALNYLQEGAIRRSDAAHLEELETIRTKLQFVRTDDELARLAAQQFLAIARLETDQQKAARLAATKHLLRWEIPAKDAEPGAVREASLASTDRALRWVSDQAKFIGRRQVHWNDTWRAAAGSRVAELTEQRAAIVQAVAAREAEQADRIKRQQALSDVLTALQEREAAVFQTKGQPVPSPRFTAVEMRMLDQLAAQRGEAAFYRAVIQLERDYDTQQIPAERAPITERISRAFGRTVMAEIAEREAQLHWQTFQVRRAQTDVLLPAQGQGELVTTRLTDVQPRSRLERAFPSFTTRSEAYQNVVQALTEHEQRLSDDLTRATETRGVLSEIARGYTARFRREFPARDLPSAQLLPKEKMRLTAYLEKEADPSLRAHYSEVLRATEAKEHSLFGANQFEESSSEKTEGKASPEFVYDSLAEALSRFAAPAAVRTDFSDYGHSFER